MRSAFLILCIAAAGLSAPVASAQPTAATPAVAVPAASLDRGVGFAGYAHLGRWVKVDPANAATIAAADAVGNVVHYPAAEGLVQLGRGEGTITWLDGDGATLRTARLGDSGSVDVVTLAGSVRLWAAVGLANAVGNDDANGEAADGDELDGLQLAIDELNAKPRDSSRTLLLPIDAADVPADADRLAELSYLYWAGDPPTPEQAAAIGDWVAEGGHVTFAMGESADWAESPVFDWAATTIEPKRYVTLGELRRLVPNSRRLILPRGREPQGWAVIPPPGGRAISGTLVAREAYGFGTVTVMGLDPALPQIATWDGLPALHFALADSRPSSRIEQKRVSKTVTRSGVSDLTTQLLAATDAIDTGSSISTWRVLGWLALFALAVGPIDYLLVHKVLRRPTATWITLPLWVAGGLLLSETLLVKQDSASPFNIKIEKFPDRFVQGVRGKRLTILDYDATRDRGRRIEYAAVHVDRLGRYDLLGQVWPPGGTQRTGWVAPLEPNFGGLYHSGGLALRASRYDAADGLAGLRGRPIEQDGAALVKTVSRGKVDGPVEFDIRIAGRNPEGTLTSRLPAPLADWFVAFDRTLFEPREPTPLLPGEPFRLSRTTVQTRGLRDSLTGLRREEIERENKTSERIILARQEFDPLSREFDQGVRTASFFEVVGGEDYAGVGLHAGEDLDLSEVLPLGRAILFGRLQTDEPIVPPLSDGERSYRTAESPTFVRVLFPLEIPKD